MKKEITLGEIQAGVKKVIREQYVHVINPEPPEYADTDSITDTLGFDSLDTVELIMALEDEFEIDISELEVPEGYNVNVLSDLIAKSLGAWVTDLSNVANLREANALHFGNMDFKPEDVQPIPVVTKDGSVPQLKLKPRGQQSCFTAYDDAAFQPLSTPWEHFGLNPIAMVDDAFSKGWFYYSERKAITDHIVATQPNENLVEHLVLVGELAVKAGAYCHNAGLAPEALTWYAGKIRTGLLTGGEVREYWIVEAFVNGHRAGNIMWEIDPTAKILKFLDNGRFTMKQEIVALFQKPATVGLNWSQP